MSASQEIKSPAWKFFSQTKNGTAVKCNRCGKEFAFLRSTTMMISHIHRKHGEEYRAMERRERTSPGTSSNFGLGRDKADKALLLAISTSNVPFQFVKNEFFVKFCQILNPDYHLNSPDQIKRQLEMNTKHYNAKIKEETDSLEKCFIALDGWTSKYQDVSIYAFFVYFISSCFERKKLFLGLRTLDGEGSAERVGELTSDILESYGIQFANVFGGVTDAGSNLTSFFKKNQLYHIHCTAHSIALVIKSATDLDLMKPVLHKVQQFAAHLSRSKADRARIRKRSDDLKISGRLPLPFCVTRWGGLVMLAEAYLLHYESILSFGTFQKYLLEDDEKEILMFFVFLTTPFLGAITAAESDSTFSSEIIMQYSSLFEFVNKQNKRKLLVQKLLEETRKRFTEYQYNHVALMATYCDPRFAFLEEVLTDVSWEDAATLIENYCGTYVVIDKNGSSNGIKEATVKPSKEAGTSFFSKFVQSKIKSTSSGSIKVELVNYKADLLSGRPDESTSPLDYWKANNNRFPCLSKVARHLLCSPQSSAVVERLFSRCGEIISSSRRNRLLPETMHNMLLNSALATLESQKENEEEFSDEEFEQFDNEDGDSSAIEPRVSPAVMLEENATELGDEEP